MIRYPISSSALRSRIRRTKDNWLSRSRARTAWLRSRGRWIKDRDGGPIVPDWGEIKPVYRKLQGKKCAYCERLLPTEDETTRENDLEHFRPKGAADAWDDGSPNPPGVGTGGGYFWLAFEPNNYCTSCKTCNQDFKKARFPIDGFAGSPGNRISTLNRAEEPLLLYPIGDHDDDPQDHITFIGHLAAPVRADSGPSRRGQANIEFFRLNDRDELLFGRAMTVSVLAEALEDAETGDTVAQETAAAFQLATSPFCGTSRAFIALWHEDRAAADIIVRGSKMVIADFLQRNAGLG